MSYIFSNMYNWQTTYLACKFKKIAGWKFKSAIYYALLFISFSNDNCLTYSSCIPSFNASPTLQRNYTEYFNSTTTTFLFIEKTLFFELKSRHSTMLYTLSRKPLSPTPPQTSTMTISSRVITSNLTKSRICKKSLTSLHKKIIEIKTYVKKPDKNLDVTCNERNCLQN